MNGYDETRVEDALLALMAVFEFDDGHISKRYPFELMTRFMARGYIHEPDAAGDVFYFTDDGAVRAKALAAQLFAPPGDPPQR